MCCCCMFMCAHLVNNRTSHHEVPSMCGEQRVVECHCGNVCCSELAANGLAALVRHLGPVRSTTVVCSSISNLNVKQCGQWADHTVACSKHMTRQTIQQQRGSERVV